jgi:hypothetical protein
MSCEKAEQTARKGGMCALVVSIRRWPTESEGNYRQKYLPDFANVYLYASRSSSVIGESGLGVDPLNRRFSLTMS